MHYCTLIHLLFGNNRFTTKVTLMNKKQSDIPTQTINPLRVISFVILITLKLRAELNNVLVGGDQLWSHPPNVPRYIKQWLLIMLFMKMSFDWMFYGHWSSNVFQDKKTMIEVSFGTMKPDVSGPKLSEECLGQEHNNCGWIIWDSLLGFSQSSSLLIDGEHLNEVGILQCHLYI